MEEFFKNNDTNIAAAPLLNEVSDILEALELCDIMMPSNASHEKENIEQSKKDFFYEMADNTLEFVEFKLTLFELDLREIKKWVYQEEMPVFYQLSDIVAICFCKVLGFELGRISYYVRNEDRSNKGKMNPHKNSILKIIDIFDRIIHLERTEISETELRKLEREILFLNSKLRDRSLIQRLVSIFK
jgi:hypothetical protein